MDENKNLELAQDFLLDNYEVCERREADTHLTLGELTEQAQGVYPELSIQNVADALRACNIGYSIIEGVATFYMKSV